MIVVEVSSENPQQVLFIENDEMIEALATDRSDDSLDVRILPGTLPGGDDLLYAQIRHAAAEVAAVDPVAIPQKEPGSLVPGKGFDDLLCGPFQQRRRSAGVSFGRRLLR